MIAVLWTATQLCFAESCLELSINESMQGINVKGYEALVTMIMMAPDSAHGKFIETSDSELDALSNSEVSAIDQLADDNCTSLSNNLMQDIIVDMRCERDNCDNIRETNTARYRSHFDTDGDGQVTSTTHFFSGHVVQIRGLVRNTSLHGSSGVVHLSKRYIRYEGRVILRNVF